MIEKCLIEHCAPTLASLKAANLFNACCEEGENIDLQISRWNQLMNPKGVTLLALRSRGNRSLVCRSRIGPVAGVQQRHDIGGTPVYRAGSHPTYNG